MKTYYPTVANAQREVEAMKEKIIVVQRNHETFLELMKTDLVECEKKLANAQIREETGLPTGVVVDEDN